AVGAAVIAMARFQGKLDVAQKDGACAVGSLSRQIAQLVESLGEGAELALEDEVALAGFLIGVEDDKPAVAIDDDLVAAGDIHEEAAQADDGGDFENAGHDGSVA